MQKNERIFVAGARGLVGSAICRKLESLGFKDILRPGRAELDLTNSKEVEAFFAKERPAYVFLAAAKVGGIIANSSFPADFIRENLMLQTNVIHSAYVSEVKKLVFLGSSCIYPRMAKQPIEESELLAGPLEPTNKAYAVAKIAGLVMCESYNRQYGTKFISAMPTNLYGPNDNFHPENSHVIPGLLRRFHEAKVSAAPEVVIWGTGSPRREFLHVDDLASAVVSLAENYESNEIVNVGTGEDLTILELAKLVAKTVGYNGQIVCDPTKPDGTPRKVLNVDRIQATGWSPKIGLEEGLRSTYAWVISNNIFKS